MTLPKTKNQCPICLKFYAVMAKHLRNGHMVHNPKERQLLLNLASGRVNIRNEQCPVMGCVYKSTRLDQHLRNCHSELSGDQVQHHLRLARTTTTIGLLKQLRATNPAVPLASTLDLGEEEDYFEDVPQELEEEPVCQNPECKRMRRKVVALQEELRKIRDAYHRQSKILRRVSKEVAQEVAQEEEQEELPGPSHVPAPVAEPSKERGPEVPGSVEAGRSKTAKRLFVGTGKGSFLRHIKFPESIESYLKKYQAFREGSLPNKKHRENVISQVSRIRSFLAYLASNDLKRATWHFLDNTEQILQWPEILCASGKTITTTNFYLRDVHQFLQYFRETPPKLARLSQSQIVGVVRAVKQARKSINKQMLAHQLKTKDRKLSKVVSQQLLRRCQQSARAKIPKLLKALQEDYTVDLRNAFYGYFSAYVASIYGHRTGVFKNMTVAEVRGAATEGQPPTGYVIRVSEHKTAKDFGPAQIFLEPEEYGWLLKWLEVRELCSPQGDRVFFTPGKGPVKNLVRYMQEAWAEMGLPGKPTFIDLRTAVSAHAKNVHVPEVRKKVARFMCHDTTTADRFYALHLDVEQSRQMRRHFQEASTLPHLTSDPTSAPSTSALPKPRRKVCASKPRARPRAREESESSSASDDVVPYQESGESCLEEERAWLEEEEEEQQGEEEEEEDVTAGPAHTPAKIKKTSHSLGSKFKA